MKEKENVLKMSSELGGTLDNEWSFTKSILSHIKGGEVIAGQTFWFVFCFLLFFIPVLSKKEL